MAKHDVRVFSDLDALADAACEHVCNRAWAAVQARGRFTLALSGGSTPRALYTRLAKHPELPWEHMELCFGDERAVPPDDPNSNARMVAETLTQHAFVPAGRVHRMRGELDPAAAADEYDAALAGVDLQLLLLGLGSDAHMASLFAGSRQLEVVDRRATWGPAGLEPCVDRVTLTLPAIHSAQRIVFLVTGEGKAEAVARAFGGEISADVPASLARLAPVPVEVFLDAAAAATLEGR